MAEHVHSIVGGSGAARRIQCPGSVLAEAKYPELEKSPEAMDGDAAHWVASERLMERQVAEGSRAPNGVIVTPAMLEGADLYYSRIATTLAPFQLAPSQGMIEVMVASPSIHAQAFGTPDFRIWLPTQGAPTLYLADYKFGFGPVEVFENAQCVDYVSGCIDQAGLRDYQVNVIVDIVQPRCFHRDGPCRRWAFAGTAIRGLVNLSSNAAHEALSTIDTPRTQVGPECRNCRARHACATFQHAMYAALSETGRLSLIELTPEQASVELAILDEAEKVIKARKTGLEEQLIAKLKRGEAVSLWRLETGVGRTHWTVPDANIILTAKMLGYDVAKPVEAMTPKQALDAGVPEKIVRHFSKTSKTAAVLVRDDGSKARSIFGG